MLLVTALYLHANAQIESLFSTSAFYSCRGVGEICWWDVFAMQYDAFQNTVGTTIIKLQSCQPKKLVHSSEFFFCFHLCPWWTWISLAVKDYSYVQNKYFFFGFLLKIFLYSIWSELKSIGCYAWHDVMKKAKLNQDFPSFQQKFGPLETRRNKQTGKEWKEEIKLKTGRWMRGWWGGETGKWTVKQKFG